MTQIDRLISNMTLDELARIPAGQLESKYHIKKLESKLPEPLITWLHEKGYTPKISHQKIGGEAILRYTDSKNYVRINPTLEPTIKYMAGGRPGEIKSYKAQELENAINKNIAEVCKKHEALVNRFGENIANISPRDNWELTLDHRGSDHEIRIVQSPYNVLDCVKFFTCGLDHNYKVAELENPELKYYLATTKFNYDKHYEDVNFLVDVERRTIRLAWYCHFDLRCGTILNHETKKLERVHAIDIGKLEDKKDEYYGKSHNYLIISNEFKMTLAELRAAEKGIARMVRQS